MKKYLFILMAITAWNPSPAQEDPEAVMILDRFSNAVKAAPSISMEFFMTTTDLPENRTDTLTGAIVISGDKYRLTMPESTTWFNGTDNWNYMPSVKEVTITRPSPDDISFFSKPSLLFGMYRQDYKARLTDQTSSEWIIDLYPNDIKSDMIRVRLSIGKQGLDLRTAEYKTRNGLTIRLDIRQYNLKFKPDSKYFDFNPAAYKGVEIIDMR
ncbi:MAG: outer membrane lipoprotein carrier protein LolA [Bacteroidales bacterium]|jgi:outer membrane lipoprotein-sorting protein|nr:outer membrane lipoprotein carrier protein LolA [Bacteroidales bacterium]